MGMGLVLNMDVLSPDEIVVDILIGKIVGTLPTIFMGTLPNVLKVCARILFKL